MSKSYTRTKNGITVFVSLWHTNLWHWQAQYKYNLVYSTAETVVSASNVTTAWNLAYEIATLEFLGKRIINHGF